MVASDEKPAVFPATSTHLSPHLYLNSELSTHAMHHPRRPHSASKKFHQKISNLISQLIHPPILDIDIVRRSESIIVASLSNITNPQLLHPFHCSIVYQHHHDTRRTNRPRDRISPPRHSNRYCGHATYTDNCIWGMVGTYGK